MSEEWKTPDEILEAEEEVEKIDEEELLEQGLKVIERIVIDYRERGYTVYLYTLEDEEPFVASIRLNGIDEVKKKLEEWIPVKVKFAVKTRTIGIDGMKEEILETRIRAIVQVEPITDYRLPWQKVTVNRRNRIYIRKETDVIFFQETENAIALEDYMKNKKLDMLQVIAVFGGNKKLEDLTEFDQIKGVFWLTKEMWWAIKERLNKQNEVVNEETEKNSEVKEEVDTNLHLTNTDDLPEEVEV